MESFTAFLNMGGYAGFVWPSFGLTFALLIGLWIVSRRTLSRAEATLESLQAAQGGGRRRAAAKPDAA